MKAIMMIAGFMLVLVGCGGGGDTLTPVSDPSTPTAPTPPTPPPTPQPTNLQTAPVPTHFLSGIYSTETLYATDSNGNTYTLNVGLENNVSCCVTFQGQSASFDSVAIEISENNNPIEGFVEELVFLDNPYTPLGFEDFYPGTNGEWSIGAPLVAGTVTSFTPPTAWTVGQSGQLMTNQVLDPNNAWINIGNEAEDYTVTAYSPTQLQVTFNISGTENGNSLNGSDTILVNASGVATLIQWVLTVNGEQLTFTPCGGTSC